MDREYITNKANQLYSDIHEKEAFISGAEWIMNCLCRMPLNIAISELHGYVKEKLETEKEKKL